MKKCFVVGNSTYNAGNTNPNLPGINLLSDGAIAIFNMDSGTLITNGNGVTDEAVVIAMGRTTGKIQRYVVYRDEVTVSTPVTPATKVAKVMYLGNKPSGSYSGLTIPSTFVEGSYAEVIVIDNTKHPSDNTGKHRYSIPITPTDTAVSVITKMINLINADTKGIVTASSVNSPADGIKLTGKTAGAPFTATLGGIWEYSNVIDYKMVNGVYTPAETTPVPVGFGVGTADFVRELEKECMDYDGQTGTFTEIPGMHTLPTRAVDGVIYYIYTIQHKTVRKNGGRTLVPADTQTLYICVPSTYNSVKSVLDSVLPAL